MYTLEWSIHRMPAERCLSQQTHLINSLPRSPIQRQLPAPFSLHRVPSAPSEIPRGDRNILPLATPRRPNWRPARRRRSRRSSSTVKRILARAPGRSSQQFDVGVAPSWRSSHGGIAAADHAAAAAAAVAAAATATLSPNQEDREESRSMRRHCRRAQKHGRPGGIGILEEPTGQSAADYEAARSSRGLMPRSSDDRGNGPVRRDGSVVA